MQYEDERFKRGVPTLYKGTTFRSRLEARCAKLLDQLQTEWKYESKAFILANGKELWPDFFLPELDTWLEVKGVIKEEDISNYTIFAREIKTEAVLLSKERGVWLTSSKRFEDYIWIGNGEVITIQKLLLGKCIKCGVYFFFGEDGSFACRKCGFNDKHNRRLVGQEGLAELIQSVFSSEDSATER